MDRRPLQLAAALFLVAGLLGVSTALVTEVREELIDASQEEPELELEGPDDGQAGLPITEFTLLDPAEAALGGARRAGDVVTLERNGTLFFDPGDSIQVAPIEVPPGASVQLLGPGGYVGNVLTCTRGCLITSDATRLAAPANASLLLPPGNRLPIPQGDVARGTLLELPPGTRLVLAPITMARATQVPLGPGTTIVLPANPGERVPPHGPSEGLFTLPRETRVRGAPGGPIDGPDAQDLLRNQDPRRESVPVPPPPTEPPQKAIIEVTEWPEVISKGQPFQVGGTVHKPDGTPSVGHPVTVYANATKERPGFEIQLGEVNAGPDGRWTAQVRIPPERPARPYHIVAEAHERLDADPPLLVGWSDPIVNVDAEPRLVLKVPAQEGVRVPVALQARLEDEHGAPVPDQELTIRVVDGTFEQRVLTDETGEALVVYKEGFPTAGTYRVSARFDGTAHLEPAIAQAEIDIVEARILTDPTILVPRGADAVLAGQVLIEGRGDPQRAIEARYANLEAETTTDDDGRFQLPFRVPASLKAGNYTMVLETVGVTATRSVVITVTGQTVLEADAPTVAPLGGTLPLQVTATDELGTPLAGLAINARTPSGQTNQALTGDDGRAVVPVPLSALGHWNLTLSTGGTPLLAPVTTQVPLHVGPLNAEGAIKLVPGEARNITLGLSVNRRPLVAETVELRGNGFAARTVTDVDGRARFQVVAPVTLAPGSTEVGLHLHRYNMVQHLVGTVLELPRLDVDVLSDGGAGEPVELRVVAVGDRGFLAGVPLVVEAIGAFDATVTAVTGQDGSALVALERPRSAQGPVAITVRAEETGTTAPALQIAQATVTAAPFPWLWLLPLPPLAAGAYAWHKRRHRPVRAPPPGPSVLLTIAPQENDPVPPVWHTGEPTELVVRLVDRHGAPIAHAEVHLDGPGGRRTVRLDADGEHREALPAARGKLLTIDARFAGEGPHRAAEATLEVRLVDYREEIDHEYRDLLHRSARAGRCGEDATPHELARALGGTDQARRMAVLFERCDYSLHPVHRGHYEEFMRAKEALGSNGATA